MKIVQDFVALYKKSPAKVISLSLLVLVGLIFAWSITIPLVIVVYLWKKFKKDEESKKSTKKKCPHCQTEIDWLATRCPNCQGKMSVWTADKKIAAVIILIFFFVGTFKMNSSTPSTSNVSNTPPPIVTETSTKNLVSSEQAQKELKDLMTLSKKAELVTSYEFSDFANVVYVSGVWYTQTVQFKKDFIAKIGMLKKSITGYTHFEVRDAYSNEKVGELTAFSQSIEVYK